VYFIQIQNEQVVNKNILNFKCFIKFLVKGQLVIASYDSQYKIFHFHHDGLDKLALIFERWNAVKAKSAGNDVKTFFCF